MVGRRAVKAESLALAPPPLACVLPGKCWLGANFHYWSVPLKILLEDWASGMLSGVHLCGNTLFVTFCS